MKIIKLITFVLFFSVSYLLAQDTFSHISEPLLYGNQDTFFSNVLNYIKTNPQGAYTRLFLTQLDKNKDFFSDYSSITNVYKSLLNRSLNPYLKFQIRKWLAFYYFSHENFPEATSLLDENSYITNWEILGPFKKLGPADLDTPLEYEKNNFNDNLSYSNNFGFLKFQKITPFSVSRLMTPYLKLPFSGIVYAKTSVYVPENGHYRLHIQTGDLYHLFINHVELFNNKEKGEIAILDLELKKGWNSFIFKIYKKSSFSYFRVAFVNPEWRAVRGSKISLANHSDNQFAKVQFIKPAEKDIVSIKSKSEKNFLLGLYANYNENYDQAYDFFLKAMKFDKTNSFYKVFFSDFILNHKDYNSSSRVSKALKLLRNLKKRKYPAVANLLASYYAGKGRTKEALEYMTSALKENPQSFESHFIAAQFYFNHNWNKEFLKEIHKTLEINPNSRSAYSYLIKYYSEKNSVLTKKYYRKRLNLNPFDYSNINYMKYLTSIGAFDEALDLGNTLGQFFHFIPSLEIERIKDEISSGQTNVAKDHVKQLINSFSNVPYVLFNSAYFSSILDDYNQELGLYAQAIKFQPSNREVLDSLTYYRSGKFYDLDSYLKHPSPEKIIKEYGSKVKKKVNTPAVFLDDEEVLKINQNGTYHKLVYQIIKIQNKDGVERWANATIDYYPNMRLLRAQTYTTQGEFIDVNSTHRQGTKYVLSFPSVEKGSILILKYIVTSTWNRVADTFFFYSDRKIFGKKEDSTLNQSYTILYPKNLPFVIDKYNFDSSISIDKKESIKNKIIVLSSSKVKTIKNELNLPTLYNLLPSFYVYFFPSKQEVFLKWYKGLIDFYFHDTSEISDKLFTLAHNPNLNNTDLNLIKKVYYWINNHIKIDSYSLYSPELPRKILDDQSGSIENKTLLMKLFLKKMNIDSEILLLRTSDMPIVHWSNFTPFLFNDILLKLNYKSRIFYLDFSSKYFKFGNYGWDRCGVRAWNLTTEKFEKIPDLATNRISLNYEIYLNPMKEWDFPISIKGKRQLFASFSVYKEYFEDADTREMTVNQIENNVFTGFDINDIEFSSISNNNNNFYYSVQGELKNWLKENNNQYRVPFPLKMNKLSQKYIAKKERAEPLRIDTPIFNRQKTILHLNDAHLKYLPDNKTINKKKKDLIRANYFIKYTYLKEKNVVVVESGLDLPIQTITSKSYADFLEFCQIVDSAEKANIIITK